MSKCFIKEIQGTYEEWFKAFILYKRSIMPEDSKGYLDQANKYIEIMLFIEAQISHFQVLEQEARLKEMKKNANNRS